MHFLETWLLPSLDVVILGSSSAALPPSVSMSSVSAIQPPCRCHLALNCRIVPCLPRCSDAEAFSCSWWPAIGRTATSIPGNTFCPAAGQISTRHCHRSMERLFLLFCCSLHFGALLPGGQCCRSRNPGHRKQQIQLIKALKLKNNQINYTEQPLQIGWLKKMINLMADILIKFTGTLLVKLIRIELHWERVIPYFLSSYFYTDKNLLFIKLACVWLKSDHCEKWTTKPYFLATCKCFIISNLGREKAIQVTLSPTTASSHPSTYTHN